MATSYLNLDPTNCRQSASLPGSPQMSAVSHGHRAREVMIGLATPADARGCARFLGLLAVYEPRGWNIGPAAGVLPASSPDRT